MTRRSPLLIALLVAALAAVAGVAFSGAAITTSTLPTQVSLGSGTLDLQSTRNGQEIVLGATGLRPGDVRQGTVSVTNNGTTPGALSFAVQGPAVDAPATPPLSGTLTLGIESCTSAAPSCPGATPIGSAATLASLIAGGPLALGSLSSSGTEHYRLTLTWPASATDPDLQAASTAVNLSFTARGGS